MSNTIQTRVKGGYIVASVSSDPNYPGIDVEYVADDDSGEEASRPRVLVEYPANDCLRALIWNDPGNEDYTEEIYLL
jgi:hypothetical protein